MAANDGRSPATPGHIRPRNPCSDGTPSLIERHPATRWNRLILKQVVGCRAPDLVKRDFPAQKINAKWYGDGWQLCHGRSFRPCMPGADQAMAAVSRATTFLPRRWKPSSCIISWSSSSSVRRASSDLIHCASLISSASEYASIGWPEMIQGRGPDALARSSRRRCRPGQGGFVCGLQACSWLGVAGAARWRCSPVFVGVAQGVVVGGDCLVGAGVLVVEPCG